MDRQTLHKVTLHVHRLPYHSVANYYNKTQHTNKKTENPHLQFLALLRRNQSRPGRGVLSFSRVIPGLSWNQATSTSIHIDWTNSTSKHDSWHVQENFIFFEATRSALGHTQRSIQSLSAAVSPVVKRPGGTVDHSLPSRAEVMNDWCYTSTVLSQKGRYSYMVVDRQGRQRTGWQMGWPEMPESCKGPTAGWKRLAIGRGLWFFK